MTITVIDIDLDEIKDLDELFDYSHSEYNFINGDDYAKYLKDNYYQDSNRTALGLYIELQTHYAAYPIGNEHLFFIIIP